MATIFTRRGNDFYIGNDADSQPLAQLPPANYVVKSALGVGIYLEKIDSFEAPPKIYGEAEKVVGRFLKTYRSRTGSTGILLSGEKGSGKTLTGKLTSIRAADIKIPTIVVNAPWAGAAFNQFVQEITQECIFFFDEFEKVYPKEKQEELLTLLDGVFPTKKLFIFTVNDKFKIDVNLTNRPGRIFYSIEYEGLEFEFIRGYAADNLKNQKHVDSISKVSTLFYRFNFDMLKALVEEMNRYDETPMQALKYLNAKPELQNYSTFEVEIRVDGLPLKGKMYDNEFRGNPLAAQRLSFEEYFDPIPGSKDKDGEEITPDEVHHEFALTDLQNINGATGEYTYIKGNSRLTLKRKKETKFDMADGYSKLGI